MDFITIRNERTETNMFCPSYFVVRYRHKILEKEHGNPSRPIVLIIGVPSGLVILLRGSLILCMCRPDSLLLVELSRNVRSETLAPSSERGKSIKFRMEYTIPSDFFSINIV